MSCMTKCDWCGLFDFCDIHDGLFMCSTCMDEDHLDYQNNNDEFDDSDEEQS